MFVDQSKCVGCAMCIPYCPVQAISIVGKQAHIDYDACVECGNCRHSRVCPKDALVQQTLDMPRAIRQVFSNPRVKSLNTGIRGRGTKEMKTNDVTDRYPYGTFGLSCEMGRPVLGTSMRDVELVARLIVVGFDFPQDHDIRLLPEKGARNCDLTTHLILLSRGILMIEYLCNLWRIPGSAFDFVGLPLNLGPVDGAQIRCIAYIP